MIAMGDRERERSVGSNLGTVGEDMYVNPAGRPAVIVAKAAIATRARSLVPPSAEMVRRGVGIPSAEIAEFDVRGLVVGSPAAAEMVIS